MEQEVFDGDWDAEDVVDGLSAQLSHPGGELVIRHRTGEVRVTIDGRFWSELDEATLRFFARRLAAIAEDGAAMLACVDGDPGDPSSSSYRQVQVHPDRVATSPDRGAR